MNNSLDFSTFSRQSVGGIVFIYLKNLYAIFKKLWVAFLPILASQNKSKSILFAISLILVVLLFFLIKSILSYLFYQFKIEDNHFIVKHGILRKIQVSIPFEKIQNINFKQNFIHQLIKVTQVDIETAGAKSVEISIKALSIEKAKAIKHLIYSSKKNQSENFEETNTEINKPILRISPTMLLKEGITENHFKSFILFAAFLFSIYSQNRNFFKDNIILKSVEKQFGEITNTLYGIFILIVFALSISLIISFIKVFLIHFNLSVYYKDKVLEIVQGLLTKKHQILKKEKVQSIVISTNPLKRKFCLSSVYFKQVSNAKKPGKKSLPTRIIGCNSKHLDTIKQFLYGNIDFANCKKHKPHNYYIVQMAIRNLFLLLILNTIILATNDYPLFYMNIGLVPLLIFFIYKKYQKSYFKFNENLLIVGSGKIGTDTTYFPYYKLQSIELRQTIFQKKRTIYDIILQNATEKIKLPCVNQRTANYIYNYFLYQTEISTKKWM